MHEANRPGGVVVVGGGPAGLAAAITAADAGATVTLLERRAGLGGRSRTDEVEGAHLNLGPHAMYEAGAALAFLRSHGVDAAGVAPDMHEPIVVDERGRHRLPDGPVGLLRTSAVRGRARLQLAKVLATASRLADRAPGDRSTAAVLAEQVTDPAARRLLHAVVRLTTYAPDADALSADAGLRQVAIGLDPGVRYVHGGWQTWVDRLAEVAGSKGVDIRRGTGVDTLRSDGPGWVVTAGDVDHAADAVVLAVGPAAARRLLGRDDLWPDLSPASTASCLDLLLPGGPLPHTFVLGLDEPWYLSRHDPPATGMAPDGYALVSIMRYGSSVEPSVEPADRRRQLETWAAGVGVGVGVDHAVRTRYLHRVETASSIPTPETGGLAGRPAPDSTGAPGVFVCGDWVGGEGLLVDASVASAQGAGRLAARASRVAAGVGHSGA